MPANRSGVERDTKAAEIIDAADKLFLSDGFDATTIAAVSRLAGVAGNTVFWYFQSKDGLLGAVLSRRLAAFRDRMPTEGSLADRVIAAMAVLDEVAPLTAAVHDRSLRSAAVAAVHEEFHRMADRALRTGFEGEGLGPDAAARASHALTSMVEGIHLHGSERDHASRAALVRWVVDRFVP